MFSIQTDMNSIMNATQMSSILFRGKTLHKGQELKSGDGKYRAVMQPDGNFVLYGGRATWASNTMGRGDRVVMQDDGNLVIYDGNHATWASNTMMPGNHNILIM